MGLFNRCDSGLAGWLRSSVQWWLPAGLALLCVAMAAFGDAGRDLLMYDRLAIADGQYWRLLSAHYVHLGNAHLLLNISGLVVIWLLVGQYCSLSHWMLVLMLSMLTVSSGFWFLDKDMLWYVGFSGVLHGLMLAGAMAGCRKRPLESGILIVMIISKLAFEQVSGPLPGSESAAGGPVAVNAHLYGAIGGIAAAGLIWRRVTKAASI